MLYGEDQKQAWGKRRVHGLYPLVAWRTGLLALLGSAAIGCSNDAAPPPVEYDQSSAALGGTIELSLQVPQPHGTSDLVLSATESLRLNDRVTIGEPGSGEMVASFGTTHLAAQATVHGTVFSESDVFLGSSSTIAGSLNVAGDITEQNDVDILGGVNPLGMIPSEELTLTVSIPMPKADDVRLEPDQNVTLSPGAYGDFDVKSRSDVFLSSGVYVFDSFNLESQAEIFLDTSAGPVQVYVLDSFSFKGAWVHSGGTPADLLVGYVGSSLAYVEGSLMGTMIAPNAEVELHRPSSSAPHVGAVFAKQIEVFSNVSVRHQGFNLTECTGQPDGEACDDGNACTQNDLCQAGVCVGGNPVSCTPSANGCTETFCEPETGQCLNAALDGVACDDGNPATVDDICVAGVCAPPLPGPGPLGDERCAFQEAYEGQLRTNAVFRTARQDIEKETQGWIARTMQSPASFARTGVYVIPVVVHVVHKNATENLSDAQIQEQIDILNEDYRKMNEQIATIPADFAPVSVDARVEFRLAQRDPNCQPTNGITRTETTEPSFPLNAAGTDIPGIKSAATGGADPWPTDRYLNMWVGDLGGLLGLGTPPGWATVADGVVMAFDAFGEGAPSTAPYDLGRTTTHEVGHYFDLWHTFQGGCAGLTESTCQAEGDLVCDTAGDATENYDCPAHGANTCTDSPVDLLDQNINFMEYVTDDCMAMFSAGQGLRMWAALNGPRASLLGSDGAYPPPPVIAPDLWSQDTSEDVGAEPNTASEVFWASDDIWVRSGSDGLDIQEHENPSFGSDPNHVYVRIRNLGCQEAPTANLNLYWAKASTALSWPAPWDGSVTAPALMGDLVGTQATGVLGPGASTVLEFEWQVPNPADYATFGGDATHFCLLSRIETDPDPPFGMTTPETADIVANVQANNNIVWKNVTVAADANNRMGSATAGGNADEAPMRLEFSEPALPSSPDSVFDWGEHRGPGARPVRRMDRGGSAKHERRGGRANEHCDSRVWGYPLQHSNGGYGSLHL